MLLNLIHGIKTSAPLEPYSMVVKILIRFWIDGLGIDWLPYIQYVIGLRKNDNFFLNEVYISRAEIPTKTENNKKSLLLLANDNLPKRR